MSSIRHAARALLASDVAATPGRHRQALAITAMFTLLLGLGITQHEFWRDEAHTWLVAGSAGSAWEMVATSFAAGHPPAWYLLLRAMRWLSASTMLMVLANGLFAVSGVYLVARFSPFSLAQRWLYPLGFYPLYQVRPGGARHQGRQQPPEEARQHSAVTTAAVTAGRVRRN